MNQAVHNKLVSFIWSIADDCLRDVILPMVVLRRLDALFLKKPQRIEAMLMIMTLCLMVYATLEYKIRKELKKNNKTFPNQLGKAVQNPTARWVFECFFAIHELYLVQIPKIVTGLNEKHHTILEVLGVRDKL
jgi:transposase